MPHTRAWIQVLQNIRSRQPKELQPSLCGSRLAVTAPFQQPLYSRLRGRDVGCGHGERWVSTAAKAAAGAAAAGLQQCPNGRTAALHMICTTHRRVTLPVNPCRLHAQPCCGCHVGRLAGHFRKIQDRPVFLSLAQRPACLGQVEEQRAAPQAAGVSHGSLTAGQARARRRQQRAHHAAGALDELLKGRQVQASHTICQLFASCRLAGICLDCVASRMTGSMYVCISSSLTVLVEREGQADDGHGMQGGIPMQAPHLDPSAIRPLQAAPDHAAQYNKQALVAAGAGVGAPELLPSLELCREGEMRRGAAVSEKHYNAGCEGSVGSTGSKAWMHAQYCCGERDGVQLLVIDHHAAKQSLAAFT